MRIEVELPDELVQWLMELTKAATPQVAVIVALGRFSESLSPQERGIYAVVTVEGKSIRYGPYGDLPTAAKLALSWARKHWRAEHGNRLTYRIEQDGEPLSRELTIEQRWPGLLADRQRRVCRFCGAAIVSYDGGWYLVDSSPEADGTYACASSSGPNGHSPKRAERVSGARSQG